MHWKKNRIVNPESKEQIIQTGQCPGCGWTVKFYYGQGGDLCPDCRKAVQTERKEDQAEIVNELRDVKHRNR